MPKQLPTPSPTGKAKDCVDPCCPLKGACAPDGDCILCILRDCSKDSCLLLEDMLEQVRDTDEQRDEVAGMLEKLQKLKLPDASG